MTSLFTSPLPVILAAGKSERMGAPKPFIQLKGKTFLENIVDKIINSGFPLPGLIIYNPEHESRLKTLHLHDFDFIPNDHVEWGQLYSVQLAVRAIRPESTGFMMCLVDHPFVDVSTYNLMLRNHRLFPKNILIPIYKGKRGHPPMFPKGLFSEITRLSPHLEGGMQTFIKDHRDIVLEVPANDPGIMMDIDKPQDILKAFQE
ncbi:nucleotidyltransferase family protein [Candidatus Sumerlaeota bacterium]|nr:nucleotidyltransferase family protein [Candidatus Sumerlaeota bacterium]